eukprot:scaffold89158_cov34-Phaeocystis_antarctica.AAC.3
MQPHAAAGVAGAASGGAIQLSARGHTGGDAAGDARDEQSRAAAQIAARRGGGGEVPADDLGAAGNTTLGDT